MRLRRSTRILMFSDFFSYILFFHIFFSFFYFSLGFVTEDDDEVLDEDFDEESAEEFILLCPQCSGPFPSIDTLRDHLEHDHGVDPKDLPDILVGQQQQLQKQQQEHLLQQKAGPGGKSLQQVVRLFQITA